MTHEQLQDFPQRSTGWEFDFAKVPRLELVSGTSPKPRRIMQICAQLVPFEAFFKR
jgi:hypothetical protein